MAATTTTQSPTPGGSLHWPIGHGGHHHHHQQISAAPHHHHRFTIAAQPRGLSPPSSPMLSSMPSPGSRTKAPLRTINRGPSFLRSSGRSANAKRKSAVELLAESKAFYVKSEKVLDSKQELRNSGHLQVAPTSAAHALSGLLSSAARPASAPKPSAQPSAVPAPVSLHCCGPRAGMGCRVKGGCGGQQQVPPGVVPPPSSFSPPSPPRVGTQPGVNTTAMLTMVMISSEGGRGFPPTPSPPSSPPPVLPPKSPRLSSSAPSGEGRGSAVYYPTVPFPPTHCTRRTRAGDSISGTANRRSTPGSGSHSEDVTMQLRRLLMPTVSREEEEAAEAERRSAHAAAAQAAAEEAAAQAAAEAAADRSQQQQQRRRRHMRRPSGAATPPPRYYRRLVDCEDDGDEEDNVGEDDSDEEDDDTHTGSHSRRSSGNDRFDTRTVAGQDASYSLRRRPRAPALNSVVHKSLPDLSTPRKSPRNSDGRESKRSEGYTRPATPVDIPDEVFRQSSGEWVEDGWAMGPMPTIPPPRRYSGGGGSGSGGGGGGSSGGRCHCCNGRGDGSGGGGGRVRQRSTPSEKSMVRPPAPALDSDDDSLDNSDDDMGMAVQRRRLSARVSPPPRHRPILRSKSDISHRYSRPANSGINSPYPPAPSSSSAPGPELPVTPIRRRPLPPPPIQQQQPCYSPPPPPMTPRSSADLERFFDRLGLGNENSSPSAPSSPCPSSPPVFFDSVSSVDSWPGNGGVGMPRESGESGGGGGRWREAMPPGSEPSIVERNARIIKWLCNCRKAQLGGGGGGVGTSR
ncbi:actin cytoskeleton-regulatory complex protein pan1-like [Ischnura elegans]|uniref:actin cytoskeleton-regulatory complex protein pan1-like n=1 Tax=Ischnura elegans TaxID=197161 RepID=UPI001ED86C63|nr:actin cytoskeleton-regulatory complex protein pan1-like [Ischnura elegans]XP_046386268.1 actin cytoskeleton-regulatory complex protein pan1-like [Ischnura elegans]